MLLITASAASAATIAVLLLLLCLYLYYNQRKSYIRLYALSLGAYLVKHCILLLLYFSGETLFLALLGELFQLLSVLFAAQASFNLAGKDMPKLFTLLWMVSLLYVVSSGLLRQDFFFCTLLQYTFLGCAYFYSGLVIQRKVFAINQGKHLISLSSAAWGIHTAVYPLAAGIEGLAGWWFFTQLIPLLLLASGIMHNIYQSTMLLDISERKRAGELQKKVDENTRLLREATELDDLKTEFFANLSHELRTPLNIILSTLKLLESYVRNSEVQDTGGKFQTRMKIMRQNCYRLLRLVNNLIDSTKIDGGFFQVKMENLNIVSIVEEITLSVVDYVGDNNINLIFDTDCEEIIMACDPDSIERIILNLLSNAVKFTRQNGSIFVTIRLKDKFAIISVRDTGIGIPEDKTETVFGRFQQVDNILVNSRQGSGIGLSLVKSLVEMHGGRISVRSELGKGSDFIIEMPVRLLPVDTQGYGMDTNKSNSLDRIERVSVEFSDIYMEQ